LDRQNGMIVGDIYK